MTVLDPNLCYNEVFCTSTALNYFIPKETEPHKYTDVLQTIKW